MKVSRAFSGLRRLCRDRYFSYYYISKQKACQGLLGIFCLLVFLPQRADQAASANELSFAVTCFASSAGKPQPYGFHITVLSTLLLFALSKP